MTTRKLEFQSRNINILNDLLHESCRVMGFEDFKFKSTFDLNIKFVDFYADDTFYYLMGLKNH